MTSLLHTHFHVRCHFASLDAICNKAKEKIIWVIGEKVLLLYYEYLLLMMWTDIIKTVITLRLTLVYKIKVSLKNILVGKQ